MTAPEELIGEIREARASFLATLDRVEPSSLSAPGLVGEWSGREIVAHLGYWTGHAVEVIHAVESGRADEVGLDEPSVDEINATVARVSRETTFATARKREEGSYQALVDRLGTLDPTLLEVALPDGATLLEAIREDSSEHYREHADELARVFDEAPRG